MGKPRLFWQTRASLFNGPDFLKRTSIEAIYAAWSSPPGRRYLSSMQSP